MRARSIATGHTEVGWTSINDLGDLATRGVRRIATRNPQHALRDGAKQALESSGLWKTLEPGWVWRDFQQAVQLSAADRLKRHRRAIGRRYIRP